MRQTVKFIRHTAIGIVILTLCSCATQQVNTGKQLGVQSKKQIEDEEPVASGDCNFYDRGLASWYGKELLGNRTANGEMFKPDGITAAHRTLPFGTLVKVLPDGFKGNPDGVTVRINDRGPFIKGRIIDLSAGAARKLGMKDTRKVKIFRCS